MDKSYMMNQAANLVPEIVVAMASEGVIGLNGKMPWHLPEDLKKFKDITMGGAIIMGRKTFESIGKCLPGRLNIVLTHNSQFTLPPGALIASSIKDALSLASKHQCAKTFVIGGAKIFSEALDIAQKAYITLIETEVEGDTFFPLQKLREKFHLCDTSDTFISKSGLRYCFEVWERN